jgi:NAD(P)H-dependent FMN reductase
LKLSRWILARYREAGAEADLLDLSQLDLGDVTGGDYNKGARGTYAKAVERVTKSEGLVVVVPEYNGSYPGILKLFIDYWHYPDSFEHRPIALVGLGLRWGGLRPVEHLQQVFGYRNAYVFPNRVFLTQVKQVLQGEEVTDPGIAELLKIQTREFIKYIRALEQQELDANSKIKARLPKK